MSNALQELEQGLHAALDGVVVGMQPVVRAATLAVVARGHLLLQGPPGLGKTLFSKTLAAALGGTCKRVQGTPDLMPADILGSNVFDAAQAAFVFRPGPVFADVLLVDEINRTGPRTQSALLEAMEERQVTVDRDLHPLPPSFLVIATQNPREFEGTYPLPESQLDRFMLRVDLDYPARAAELEVLARYGAAGASPAAPGRAVAADAIARARATADAVHVAPELSGYVLDLAQASREHVHVSLGLSTRGALALLRATRIAAGLRGADYATPDDVKAVFPLVVPHRLTLAPEAMLEGVTDRMVAARLLEQTPVPR